MNKQAADRIARELRKTLKDWNGDWIVTVEDALLDDYYVEARPVNSTIVLTSLGQPPTVYWACRASNDDDEVFGQTGETPFRAFMAMRQSLEDEQRSIADFIGSLMAVAPGPKL